MTDNFKQSAASTEWKEGENLSSASDAIDALKKAAPQLRCPVCSTEVFVLQEDFDKKLRTILSRYQLPFPDSKTFDALVSLSCDNCGYVMSFVEEKLQNKIAGRG